MRQQVERQRRSGPVGEGPDLGPTLRHAEGGEPRQAGGDLPEAVLHGYLVRGEGGGAGVLGTGAGAAVPAGPDDLPRDDADEHHERGDDEHRTGDRHPDEVRRLERGRGQRCGDDRQTDVAVPSSSPRLARVHTPTVRPTTDADAGAYAGAKRPRSAPPSG